MMVAWYLESPKELVFEGQTVQSYGLEGQFWTAGIKKNNAWKRFWIESDTEKSTQSS